MDKQKALNKVEQLITILSQRLSNARYSMEELEKAKTLAMQIRAEIRKAE